MSNTFSSALTTDYLSRVSTTSLVDLFSPLANFAKSFAPDGTKPNSTIQLKFVTGGPSPMVNTTSFQAGDSIVASAAVTMAQVTTSVHVNPQELAGGLRLADLAEVHWRAHAGKLQDVVLAIASPANFTVGRTVPSGGFNWSDAGICRALIKKSDSKNLLLDGSYFSSLADAAYFEKNEDGTFKTFGWDSVSESSRFSAAGNNVVGLAFNPQAIGVGFGIPVVEDGPYLRVILRTIPGLELPVAQSSWLDAAGRTGWWSLDSMIGAVLLDKTAGSLITSS